MCADTPTNTPTSTNTSLNIPTSIKTSINIPTRDNIHLSRLTMVADSAALRAINCMNLSVADYVRESLAQHTRTAYLSDLEQFESWGGQITDTQEIIADYIADHEGTNTIDTLNRRHA